MADEVLAANVIIENQELLMLHRKDKGYWELPAGKVEAGETPREAALREAAEEIGCQVEVRTPWGRFDLDFEHENTTYATRGFLADIVDGTPTPKEDKFDELAWMDADALIECTLAPNLRLIRDDLRLLLMRST